jgi:hypothetical protein
LPQRKCLHNERRPVLSPKERPRIICREWSENHTGNERRNPKTRHDARRALCKIPRQAGGKKVRTRDQESADREEHVYGKRARIRLPARQQINGFGIETVLDEKERMLEHNESGKRQPNCVECIVFLIPKARRPSRLALDRGSREWKS